MTGTVRSGYPIGLTLNSTSVTRAQVSKAQTFSEFIKERRKKLMLTQRDVAEKVAAKVPGDVARGFDVTYLSKIENARLAPPSTVAILALAQVLETDADNLLALAGKVPPDVGEKLKESPGARAFFRSAVDLDLPEKEWQRLLEEMKKPRKGRP